MNVGLVFGIIFAIIVMGFTLFFGFKYINEVMSLSCESQMGQQVTNLENGVESTLALSMDSVQKLKIIIPACIEKMCFVDPDYPELESAEGGWAPDGFLTDFISRYKYNVVIIKSSGQIDGYEIDKFKPYINFCLTSTKTANLRNTGTIVEITLPEFG